MRFEPTFPVAFEDHYGAIYVFLSPSGAKKMYEQLEDGIEESELEELNLHLLNNARVLGTDETFFTFLYFYAESGDGTEWFEIHPDVRVLGV